MDLFDEILKASEVTQAKKLAILKAQKEKEEQVKREEEEYYQMLATNFKSDKGSKADRKSNALQGNNPPSPFSPSNHSQRPGGNRHPAKASHSLNSKSSLVGDRKPDRQPKTSFAQLLKEAESNNADHLRINSLFATGPPKLDKPPASSSSFTSSTLSPASKVQRSPHNSKFAPYPSIQKSNGAPPIADSRPPPKHGLARTSDGPKSSEASSLLSTSEFRPDNNSYPISSRPKIKHPSVNRHSRPSKTTTRNPFNTPQTLNSLVKLNQQKRDLRTIEEIQMDIRRKRGLGNETALKQPIDDRNQRRNAAMAQARLSALQRSKNTENGDTGESIKPPRSSSSHVNANPSVGPVPPSKKPLEEDYGNEEFYAKNYSSIIRDMFGSDKRPRLDDDNSSDDMEASAEEISREERRSTKIAKLEDAREDELERKRITALSKKRVRKIST